MLKKDEVSNPNSCLGKAADDEPIFVLRAKDICASGVVRIWAQRAKDIHSEKKIKEALEFANIMEDYRYKRMMEEKKEKEDETK